ncbi:MAG: 4-hydroxy-tetrahydrodipicolinate reductase [Candidatus Altiarchaeota archaeon]
MTIKVAFLGLGKMGRAAAKSVFAASDMKVVAGFDIGSVGQDIGVLAGCPPIGVKVDEPMTLEDVLSRTKPDVVVDFSSPAACLANAKAVTAAGANMVIGTTGFSDEDMARLKKSLKGAVISPNMSVGVNVFFKLVGEAAKDLRGYDVEVVESHHKFKKDAPSGTAMKAVKAITEAVGADMKRDVIYGRHGECPRKGGQICIHSIRAGDIVGEHTVMFTSEGERFELRHVAHSRDSFASGIPAAIRFVDGKEDIYDMADVLGLK